MPPYGDVTRSDVRPLNRLNMFLQVIFWNRMSLSSTVYLTWSKNHKWKWLFMVTSQSRKCVCWVDRTRVSGILEACRYLAPFSSYLSWTKLEVEKSTSDDVSMSDISPFGRQQPYSYQWSFETMSLSFTVFKIFDQEWKPEVKISTAGDVTRSEVSTG